MHSRGPMLTSWHPFAATVLFLWPALYPSAAQVAAPFTDPRQAMEKAEHLADIYNWYDAHPYYLEAEKMFLTQGDERNALFARASRLRGEMQIVPFPEIIDAIDAGRTPGEVFEIDPSEIPIAKLDDFSLHQLPTSNLLRELQETCGIEVRVLACQTGPLPQLVCPGLSNAVSRAVPQAAARLVREFLHPPGQ